MLLQSLLVIFAIIGLGVFCQRTKILNEAQIEGFEIFLFKIIIPSYLFSVTLQHDLAMLLHPEYIMAYLLTFGLVALGVCFLFYKKRTGSILCINILASGYVNAAIYALPIITFLLHNPTAGVLGNLLQVIIIQPIFIMILNFIHHKEKSIAKKLLSIVCTPLIVLPIIGLLCNYYQVHLPYAITQTFKSLGDGASSIALFSFGLTVGGLKLSKKHIDKNLLIIVFTKNILHPIIAFCVGKYFFHLESYWLYSLVIAASSPTAFVIYLIAKQFSIEPMVIKRVVMLSAICSLISLMAITFIF
jgi:malonate transporter